MRFFQPPWPWLLLPALAALVLLWRWLAPSFGGTHHHRVSQRWRRAVRRHGRVLRRHGRALRALRRRLPPEVH
jgi:hypothetical protein